MSRASPQQAWTPRSSDRKAAGVCGVTPQGRAVGGGPFSLCSQSLAIIGKVWGPRKEQWHLLGTCGSENGWVLCSIP